MSLSRLGLLRRPLPWAILAMAALLVLKVAGLLQGVGGSSAQVLTNAGRAVLPAALAAGHPAVAPASAQPTKAGQAGAGLPRSETDGGGGPCVAAAPVAPPEPPVGEAERALLQDLRSRRGALDGRDQALQQREAVLAAAERRLTERVDQLAALQARLEGLDQSRRERDEANWRGLVKTYETMRPKDAATILNDMDQAVLIQVLDRMKEAKAAPLLAAMQPERARFATAELAKWRSRTTTP